MDKIGNLISGIERPRRGEADQEGPGRPLINGGVSIARVAASWSKSPSGVPPAGVVQSFRPFRDRKGLLGLLDPVAIGDGVCGMVSAGESRPGGLGVA